MADVPGGYFGRALVVDVSDGGQRVLPLPERVLREHLGGAGLGAWLLHELAPPGIDPLAPEAPLAFVFSPLVGTPLTTSAKFAVVAKSPLTGLLTDSLASSSFAISGKLTGHDAIVLVGAAAAPVTVAVDGNGLRLLDAADQWGRSAADAEAEVVQSLGRGWRVATIGSAGERGVRYATISHDGRHAGRGGLGAVLGAKRVKAVAVHAATKVAPADPAGVLAAARDLRRRTASTSAELGSMGELLEANALRTLPTRNFQGETGAVAVLPDSTRASCASCSIGCTHLYPRREGRAVRLERQSIGALGPLCGVDDAEVVAAAGARCDELGVDTISAGGTIAWAMECAERGLLDADWLRFGDGNALLRALDEIHSGTGLGPLLALGSRAAAARIGDGAERLAAHVKGLELPGYDPRARPAVALGLAVNARGADHNRSGVRAPRPDAGATEIAAVVRQAVEAEDRAAVMDSLILCGFLREVFDDPFAEWAVLLSLVTGWDVDANELRETAGRIVALKRAFNLREGWRPEDDWLPERFVDDEEQLRQLVDGYWAARGLDPQGRPA